MVMGNMCVCVFGNEMKLWVFALHDPVIVFKHRHHGDGDNSILIRCCVDTVFNPPTKNAVK